MDWKAVVGAILESGRTQVEIADTCGCAQSTISAIYRGENKNPSFALGQSLLSLKAMASSRRRRSAKEQASA